MWRNVYQDFFSDRDNLTHLKNHPSKTQGFVALGGQGGWSSSKAYTTLFGIFPAQEFEP